MLKSPDYTWILIRLKTEATNLKTINPIRESIP